MTNCQKAVDLLKALYVDGRTVSIGMSEWVLTKTNDWQGSVLDLCIVHKNIHGTKYQRCYANLDYFVRLADRMTEEEYESVRETKHD